MPPPIIAHAEVYLKRYDVVLCDVWGVVHDGETAYAGACDALARFRAGGGIVLLVSNAPYPAARGATVIAGKGVGRDAWDAIVSSGDIALRHIADQGYARAYCIGPEPRDSALFDSLPCERTGLAEADVVVCSGLLKDRTETAEDYRPVLARALSRRLPLVCANPDLVVDVGAARLPCAGALAALYDEMGGTVFWAGKPDPVAYRAALERAGQLRGGPVAAERVLAIGDALRTDLAAAQGAGVDALFIAGGIHGADVIDGDVIDPVRLAALFADGAPPAIAAMTHLRW